MDIREWGISNGTNIIAIQQWEVKLKHIYKTIHNWRILEVQLISYVIEK